MSFLDTVNQFVAQPQLGNPHLAYALADGVSELARRLGRGARTAVRFLTRGHARIVVAPGDAVSRRDPRV